MIWLYYIILVSGQEAALFTSASISSRLWKQS